MHEDTCWKCCNKTGYVVGIRIRDRDRVLGCVSVRDNGVAKLIQSEVPEGTLARHGIAPLKRHVRRSGFNFVANACRHCGCEPAIDSIQNTEMELSATVRPALLTSPCRRRLSVSALSRVGVLASCRDH